MTNDDEFIVDRARGAVWLLTLNRPAARNALTTPLLARLAATLAAAEADEAVRAVVLTGGPDCFAAGADIGEHRRVLGVGGIELCQRTDHLRRWRISCRDVSRDFAQTPRSVQSG